MWKWILFLGSFLALVGFGLSRTVPRNIAYLALNRALGSANESQANDIVIFAQYWDQTNGQRPTRQLENLEDTPARQAFFIATYYMYHQDMSTAIQWYQYAIADPSAWPDATQPIWRERLMPDGQILLDDFVTPDFWKVDEVNSNVTAVTLQSTDSIVHISYPDRPDTRDRLAYSLFPNPDQVPLGYHRTLAVRVQVATNSYLTLETVTDGMRQRHLDYVQGRGEWQILRLPLEGDILKEIKIIISEPDGPSDSNSREVWFDWVKLEMDLP